MRELYSRDTRNTNEPLENQRDIKQIFCGHVWVVIDD